MKAKVSISCSKDKLKQVRGFVAQMLEANQVPELQKSQVILAVDEACANAIIHGNLCDESREIEMEIELVKKQLQIMIYDIGKFNAHNSKKNNLETLVKQKRKGGLGLTIMKNIMDEVHFFEKNGIYICSLKKALD